MNEHEELIARLRALGSQPVGVESAARHLAAMEAEPDAVRGGTRSRRLKIVGAFVVGLFVGTSGLATAGALPDGAQEVAHTALGAVGMKAPHGDRYQGPECGGTVKNHGQYVRSQLKEKRAEAAASRCGKPVQAGTGDDGGTGGQSGEKGPCQGKPPWAGKGKPDAAAKAARKQACGQGQEDGDYEKESPAPSAGTQPAGPLTPETPTTDPTSPIAGTTGTDPTAPAATVTGPAGGGDTGQPGTTGADASTTTTAATGPAGSGVGADGQTVPSAPVEPPPAGLGS